MSGHLRHLLGVSKYETDVDFDSLERVPGLDDFFKWFEHCIDTRNCVTPFEKQTYQALSEADTLYEVKSKLSNEYDRLFAGDASVYPHSEDTAVLQRAKNKIANTLDSWSEFEAKTRLHLTNNESIPVHPALQKLVESEKRKTDDSLSSLSKMSLSAAVSVNQLQARRFDMRIVEKLTSPEFIGRMHELENYSKDCVRRSREMMYQCENMSHNLEFNFNTCTSLQKKLLKLSSRKIGLVAALEANFDETSFSSSCSSFHEISDEEIARVGYFQATSMANSFCRSGTTLAQVMIDCRQRCLDHVICLGEIIEPLRLCSEAFLASCEFLLIWMTCVDHLHSSICRQLEEAGELIGMNQIISSSSAASKANGVDRPCRSPDILQNNMFKHEIDAHRNLTVFSVETRKALSCAKTIYNAIFPGPTATPSVDLNLFSSIANRANLLKSIGKQLEKTQQSWNSHKNSHRDDMYYRLVRLFWYVYLGHPEALMRTVNCLREAAESWQRPMTDRILLYEETPAQTRPRTSLIGVLENPVEE